MVSQVPLQIEPGNDFQKGHFFFKAVRKWADKVRKLIQSVYGIFFISRLSHQEVKFFSRRSQFCRQKLCDPLEMHFSDHFGHFCVSHVGNYAELGRIIGCKGLVFGKDQ